MANVYEIRIGNYFSFGGDSIESIEEANAVSIVGDSLSIDELNARIYSDSSAFKNIPRATPVEVYVNGAIHSKYYYTETERVSDLVCKITAVSGIGLLDALKNKGGMWIQSNGVKFSNIVANIIGGTVGTLSQGLYPVTGGAFDCFIEQALANQIITGHLPYSTARNNLHWLLLSYGATITKSSNGDILFAYLKATDSPENIEDDNIYCEGSVVIGTPKTQVQVEEHTFIDRGTNDESVIAFDSAKQGSANNDLIVFSEPYHNLTANGITIHESNCNYAIISGSGTLTGYKYTHSTRILSKGTASAKENIASCSGVELINPINSQNVLERLFSYYTEAIVVKSAFVLSDEKSGRQYSFKDINNTSRNGFIEKINLSSSGIIKATAEFITNYKPTGQGNNFTNFVLLTGTGTWTVPQGISTYRAILIGGGNGANGGYNGTSGSSSSVHSEDRWTRYFDGSTGGKGGKGSAAAKGGKVFTVDQNNATSGTVISYSCGTGGTGGARNGGTGGTGTATTFGSYSSDNGSSVVGGIINLFNGDIYAEDGYLDGIDGADGGSVDASLLSESYTPHNGADTTYNTQTWSGGTGGGSESFGITGTYVGGGGGGSAYGSNGGNANPPRGGNGANASPFPVLSSYGCGANGSNGGGGGGGGGYEISNYSFNGASGGSGGLASESQSGGNGCVIIYY